MKLTMNTSRTTTLPVPKLGEPIMEEDENSNLNSSRFQIKRGGPSILISENFSSHESFERDD